MSCIITYKGNKYTQEQFKEYISNNKKEFSHIMASNKNVIDSFKRKMEGIDFVFSQSPELASIGSKAQYLQYLSTIFKTSKVKDIVYHGTNLNFDKFDKKKIGGNTAVKGEKPSFSFSTNKQQAEAYSSEVTVGQNTNELAEVWFDENQHIFKNEDITTGIIDVNNVIEYYRKELENSKEMISPTEEIDPITNKYKLVPVNNETLKQLAEIKTKEWQEEYDTLLTAGARVMSVVLDIKSPKIIDFKGEKKSVKFKEEQLSTVGDSFIAKNIDDWGKGDVIQVFEPEQIHILSSKKDLEMFRNFINFKKSEYAEYGDIQQSFAVFEEEPFNSLPSRKEVYNQFKVWDSKLNRPKTWSMSVDRNALVKIANNINKNNEIYHAKVEQQPFLDKGKYSTKQYIQLTMKPEFNNLNTRMEYIMKDKEKMEELMKTCKY